ncbi:MAG: asparaginase [Candidatus Pristimantibacillus sp.]
MKKLLVMFTGGTIGSKNNEGTVSVNEAGSYYLIDAYIASPLKREVRLQTAQPLNILSENLVPDDWNILIRAINEVDKSLYDGIIVTHGSDTLAYTAAMLSYVCCNTTIPIVLVASNYPLDDARSNGLHNFASAINFIAQEGIPGVFVVYRNDKGESVVYLGSRITQALSFTDQFDSPYSLPYGEMIEGELSLYEHPYNPALQELRSRAAVPSPWSNESSALEAGLLYIKPFPGIDYSYYDFREREKAPKAILHDLYHSGTASANATGNHSLLRFAEFCAEHGVDLYLCPLKDSSEALYASSVSLLEAGVTFIENMSVEAALMKLTLAYSMYREKTDVQSFVMDTSLFYEFIRPIE